MLLVLLFHFLGKSSFSNFAWFNTMCDIWTKATVCQIYSFYQLVPSANTKLTSWLTGKELNTMKYAQIWGQLYIHLSVLIHNPKKYFFILKYYFKSKDKIILKTDTIVTTLTTLNHLNTNIKHFLKTKQQEKWQCKNTSYCWTLHILRYIMRRWGRWSNIGKWPRTHSTTNLRTNICCTDWMPGGNTGIIWHNRKAGIKTWQRLLPIGTWHHWIIECSMRDRCRVSIWKSTWNKESI